MDKNDISREINFLSTNLNNLSYDLKKVSNKKADYILTLPNSDFYLTDIEYIKNQTPEENYDTLLNSLKAAIPDYSPETYINHEIYIQSLDENTHENSLIISFKKENLKEIIKECKKSEVFIAGIYPSFLMGDQENLKSLANKFSFITVEEVEDSEEDESGNKKITLVLLYNDEPLNLIERLLEEFDIPEYNFLIDEFQIQIKRPLIKRKIKNIFLSILAIQIVFYITINIMTASSISKINTLRVSSTKLDNQIKDIAKEINLLPNWEARLRKLEEIFSQRSTSANEVVYAIKKSVPRGLFIDKLEFSSVNIFMTGTTDDVEKIFRFERFLEEMGFINVKHTTISNSTTGFSFEIESNIQ